MSIPITMMQYSTGIQGMVKVAVSMLSPFNFRHKAMCIIREKKEWWDCYAPTVLRLSPAEFDANITSRLSTLCLAVSPQQDVPPPDRHVTNFIRYLVTADPTVRQIV